MNTDLIRNILLKGEKYDKFKYIFPPRPENKITPDRLSIYETKYNCLGQPKFNGSNCEIYLKKSEVFRYFGRHNNENIKDFRIPPSAFNILTENTDKWCVFVGELMNKSKKYKGGKVWNDKFVIFDILVYDGVYLIGTTFKERVLLLDEILGINDYDEFMYTVGVSSYIFRAKSFYKDFSELYNSIIVYDMFEGWVMKVQDAPLKRGLSEINNHTTQFKCRKPSNSYTH